MADARKQTLTVYVPAENSEIRGTIAAGSAIVGSEYRGTGRLRIDFEGNLYDLDDLKQFEAKLQRAAERHLANDGRGAETVACAYVDRNEVVAVGEYAPRSRKVTIQVEDRLKSWLN